MSRERSCVRATVAPAAITAPEAAAADVGIKSEEPVYALASRYLGGKKFWHRRLDSRLDIHSAIVSGVAYGSVIFLVSQVKELKRGDLSKVLGISTRKLRRHGGDPEKQMPTDLTSRAWLFAESWARATEVFGGKKKAERWMSERAIGLGGRRPVDLLQTIQGAALVNDLLSRIYFGVYT